MELSIVAQVVGIIGGVIAIIRGLQELAKGGLGASPSLSEFVNIVTKLIIAAGIVAALYGGVVLATAGTNVTSTKQACLRTKDSNSYSANQACNEYARLQYQRDSRPGFIFIGISFILIATGLFVRTIKTASILLYVLELVWFIVGVWLIQTNI